MAREISVVVLKDGSTYVAQCLEVDIAAQGRTLEEAKARLGIALRSELQEAENEGRDLFDLGPAPDAFRVVHDTDVIDRTQMVA